MTEKERYRLLISGFLVGVITSLLLISQCGCEKYEGGNLAPCDDSITWGNYTGAKVYVQVYDVIEGDTIPSSSVYIINADDTTLITPAYAGDYYGCLLGKHWNAYVMIDPVNPGTEGEWVYCMGGKVQHTNMIFNQ